MAFDFPFATHLDEAAEARTGGKMSAMRFGIVEGEPGIFPDPIVQLFRLLGRAFKRDPRKDDLHPRGQDQRLDHESRPSSA